MVQVAAWFVAGVAWSIMALIGPVMWRRARDMPESLIPIDVWMLALSSGVAVAATVVALGVGR